MSNRKKRFVRAYAENHGMKYQAAFNAVAEDVLRSFHAPSYGIITRDGKATSYGTTTFSLQCKRCARWIHAGGAPRTSTCFCGQKYRVIFVPEEDWSLPHGPCCMDCGAVRKLTQPHEGYNPWHLVNEWQERCNRCQAQANPNSQAQSGDQPTGRSATMLKYVHVHYGTSQGTIWLLSDEPEGAVLSIPVGDEPLTPNAADEAFHRAVFPVVVETSSDGGKTWVQHPDDNPKPNWRSALRRLYGLLGVGGGHWRAGRIRARSGEDLVRHPPKLLQDIAAGVQARIPGARTMLQAPMDQLFVHVGNHSFAVGTLLNRATQWPVYVAPVGPGDDLGGSWECFTVDDVLSTLRYPTTHPPVRIATFDELRTKSEPQARQEGRPRSSTPFEPAGHAIKIVPQFDASDPTYKTRIEGGVYKDRPRPVVVVNSGRRVLVWIFPSPHGRAGWSFDIMHREGPWPLQPDERAALEDWLEHFAEEEWPEREQLWPATYRAKAEMWEQAQEAGGGTHQNR